MAVLRGGWVTPMTCALVVGLAGAGGCGQAPAGPGLTGKPGSSGTRQLETKEGKVVRTRADAHYVNWDDKLALVVLCDFSGSERGGGADTAGHFHGVSAAGGRKVEWRWETTDGKSGTVVINGQKYDRADGGLFLVYTAGEKPRVVQRKLDFQGDEKTLDELAKTDPEVKQFVAGAAEPR
jgi:hypothetical protein